MIRLGLFGGTFDPVHYGHLHTVEAARLELNLSEIWMLPNPHPPHKLDRPLTLYHHRKAMLALALEEFPHLRLSDTEEHAKGPAYTTDTIRRVVAQLPDEPRELWLIVGADSLVELPKWKNPEDLFLLSNVAVLSRPGISLDDAPEQFRDRVRILKTPLIPISATELREKIGRGTDVSAWIPPAVCNYIARLHLYSR